MAPIHLLYQFLKLSGESLPSPLLLSLTFFFFIYLLKLKLKYKKLNLPPSPPKLPIIGNLHQLGKLPYRSFQALADKYGPIVLLHWGHSPTIVITSPHLARETMKTHDIIFANRSTTTAQKCLFYGCKDVAFAPYGEYWRQMRKVCVLELLSFRRVQSFQNIREEEVQFLIESICSSAISGSPINLSLMLLSTSYGILSKAAFGRKYEGKNDLGVMSRKVAELLLAFSVGDFYPSMAWMDNLTGLKAKLKETFKVTDDFLNQVIDEHRVFDVASVNMSDKKDFVDVILDLQRNGMLDCNLAEDSIKAILMDMYVGGTETASTTIEWAISELIRNPIVMKKAQEEVRSVVGNKEKVDESDTIMMEYLQCVIKETLRLHPPAPLLVPRESSAPVKLGNYDIPPKTRVIVNAWAIQRDPKLWERPEEFLPERFKDNPIDFKGKDFEFFPFGSGRRGCPGMTFAIAVVELTLASLLNRFNWEMPGGERGEDLDMSEAYGITIQKKIQLQLLPKVYSKSGPCSVRL